MNQIFKIIPILFAFATGIALTSCEDDFNNRYSQNENEGENTVISLKLRAPEMSKVVSRAGMDNEDAYNVRTLWVGIYNATNGKSTLTEIDTPAQNGLFLESGDHGFQSPTGFHDAVTITDIPTKSGKSYIVAVANPDNNMGYMMTTGENNKPTLGTETNLLTLLRSADTWEKFRSIIIERDLFQGNANINMPNVSATNPIPMSGIYVAGKDDVADWSGVEPTYIPLAKTNSSGDVEGVPLNGYIHLRRPYTQIKVNFSKADDAIVDIEPVSYTIHNVPTYSWLYERAQIGGDAPTKFTDYANAGDAIQPEVALNENYKPSLTYTSTDFTLANNIYSFDFWMMENKRTGIAANCKEYKDRELEYKDDGKNSGVYKSLCPPTTSEEDNTTTYTETLNNMATYMEIKCKLTYTGTITPPDGITLGPDETITSREVEATYIVHLGYVGRVATDFNSYRNSIYTYNIKVKSANNIIVEALKEGEPQPGAEGIVTDAINKNYELDAHYNAFNIQLTEDDLSGFSFVISSYYNNTEYIYGQDDKGNTIAGAKPIPASNSDEYLYYSWVELMPTTGESVLAPYPGTAKTYKLGDVRGNEKLTPGWFTVFVNEYTYETSGDETKGKWKGYVNQPNRIANIGVKYTSSDEDCSYYLTKYGISQKSIQTYYDSNASTAIGVEHDNETFGMVIRWPTAASTSTTGATYPAVTADGLSADNGRYNVWIKSGGTGGGSTAGSWTTYVQCGDASKQKSDANYYGQINNVNAISNTNQTGFMKAEALIAKTYPVPQPVLLGTSALTQAVPDGYTTGAKDWDNSNITVINNFDPQTTSTTAQIIHAMHACMNRNRDINGDGVINANELKWYLPASGKYVRVIMGRNALSSPILNYQENATLPFHAQMGWNSRLHLIASDGKMMWVDEGMSTSNFLNRNYGPAPWAVRCIRNLGVNLSTVTATATGDPIEAAYKFTPGTDGYVTGGVCKVLHYYGTSLREPSSTSLPVHKVPDPENKLGMYGFEVALRGNGTNNGNTYAATTTEDNFTDNEKTSFTVFQTTVDNASPCSSLETKTGRKGWRIPNQKELVIMSREKILNITGNNFMGSCTQEYWTSGTNTGNATSSSTPSDQFRFSAIRSSGDVTAQPYSALYFVRCVRDLTAAEANMTYNQILEYKQP